VSSNGGLIVGKEFDFGADDAATSHTPQIEAFAEAGADLGIALTLTGTGEAIGVVRAAAQPGSRSRCRSPWRPTVGSPTAQRCQRR
jgi:S-methylmethionine-dependent homocysteine/selenocysteine methylase